MKIKNRLKIEVVIPLCLTSEALTDTKAAPKCLPALPHQLSWWQKPEVSKTCRHISQVDADEGTSSFHKVSCQDFCFLLTTLWRDDVLPSFVDCKNMCLSMDPSCSHQQIFPFDSPKISPTPIKIPERPMRLFSSLPNLFTAPMHVPYTPEKNVNSNPLKESTRHKIDKWGLSS